MTETATHRAPVPAPEVVVHEARNLSALALHHIVLRIAWVFKTESVIIPAFLDAIAGAGWVRGCLPVLNRFGQSVPPLMFAERLRRSRRKKWSLLGTTLLMAGPFLVLAGLWMMLADQRPAWLPGVFLLLYALFFSATGLNQLSFATLQGKLIRPHRRGRLLSLSGILGAVFAIVCVWILLPGWLARGASGFGVVFLFTGVGFALSGLVCLPVFEPPDEPRPEAALANGYFRTAWDIVRADAAFRRLVSVAMLFVTMQLLFPHFQALGRERLGTGPENLMHWIVAQNAGIGVFSLISGAIADRAGNRLALRLCILFAATVPLLATALAYAWIPGGKQAYWTVFLLLGTTSVTFRTITNYTLEIADPHRHPQYVSTLKLCMAVPFLLSPLAGALIDVAGFGTVFVAIAALIGLGGLLTFRLAEPRLGRDV